VEEKPPRDIGMNVNVEKAIWDAVLIILNSAAWEYSRVNQARWTLAILTFENIKRRVSFVIS
jgi:hypothetical protein